MEHWHATGSEIESRQRAELGEETLTPGAQVRRALRQTRKELFTRPDWVRLVNGQTLRADLLSGLTGASLVLPQGIAFAAIAGLPPEYGFYASIVPTIIAALLGSSWHAVTGATTALSALVFGALAGGFVPGSPEFIAAAISMAFLVGLFQLLLGLLRMGTLVDFVSHSVMTGFVTGAALLIATSQLRHVLNLDLPRPEDPLAFVRGLALGLPQADLAAVALSVTAIVVGLLVKRIDRRLPHYLVALLAATLLGRWLSHEGAQLDTVGSISSVLPVPKMPDLSPGLLRDIVSGSFAVAFVGLLEAVSIARAMAGKSGQMLDGNREFIGQGAANLVGSFFQAYPVSASFTRSAVNYDSGARTPLAAIFSAVLLVAILLLIAPLFSYVPIAGLAGVILLVAWRLVDFREIRHIWQSSAVETVIAGATFFSTVFISLEFAIYTGVILSLLLFLARIAQPVIAVVAPDPTAPSRHMRSARLFDLQECPQLMITAMHGPLYFGTVEATRRDFHRFRTERPSQKHILFMTPSSSEMDLPAAQLLVEEARKREEAGGSLHLKIGSLRALNKLARFHVVKTLGRSRVHLSKRDAIAEIIPDLDPEICRTCQARIFRECARQPGAEEAEEQANDQTGKPSES